MKKKVKTYDLTLFTFSNLKCQCLLKDGIETLQNQLSKTKETLENKNDREINKWMKHVEKTLQILQKQERDHFKYRVDFAKELIEQKKLWDINGNKSTVQTVSYLTGKAKEEDLLIKENTKKRGRKRKKTDKK